MIEIKKDIFISYRNDGVGNNFAVCAGYYVFIWQRLRA